MQGKRRRATKTKQERQQQEEEKERPTKRQAKEDMEEEAEGDSRVDMMTSMVTRVSMNRVKSTWPLLSETGQQEVMRLLEDASRPVIQAIPGDKKRLEFQETLSDVLHRTQRKLRKIPVPPNTRENFYKYDSLVNQREQLELALLPLLDQISLLEQEIASEKKSVDRDQVYLDRIKRDAKNHKHAFATSTQVATDLLDKYNSSDEDDLDDMPESIGLHPNPPSSAFETEHDEQLNPILSKLTKNLSKIKQSTEGVDALTKACQKLESDLAM
jgi:5-formyltetrahydrofolate cyclo-ligase